MEVGLSDTNIKYQRVLLKLSGEALMGERSYGIDPAVPQRLAEEIRPVWEAGVQVAIVVGGGNIFRGLAGAAAGMDRAQGDNMGMLATVINSLSLQDCFERNGMDCRVMSAIEMRQIAEPYIRRARSATLRRGASPSMPPALATPTSPPTPRRPSAPARSTQRSS